MNNCYFNPAKVCNERALIFYHLGLKRDWVNINSGIEKITKNKQHWLCNSSLLNKQGLSSINMYQNNLDSTRILRNSIEIEA